jgi:hypothetical protein
MRDSLEALRAAGVVVAGRAGCAGALPPAGSADDQLLSDADKHVLRAYGAYGKKKLYGNVIRCDPVDSSSMGGRPARQHIPSARSGVSPKLMSRAP